MPGWSEGVTGMQPGGRRLVLLPPVPGYGVRAIDGMVPADSSLMFLFALLDVQPAGPGARSPP